MKADGGAAFPQDLWAKRQLLRQDCLLGFGYGGRMVHGWIRAGVEQQKKGMGTRYISMCGASTEMAYHRTIDSRYDRLCPKCEIHLRAILAERERTGE